MDNLFWIGFVGAALALIFAYLQKCKVMKCSEGDEKMVKIASSIRAGANAYLKQQYSTVAKVFAVVFVILLIIAFASKGQMLSRVTPFAFLTGGIWSMLAGLIGMKIATAANARTANAAHESLNHGLNERWPTGIYMAEDSTNFLKVTAPTRYDGVGFDYKWDMGWMHDTLDYFATPFGERPNAYGKIVFSMHYFYNELYLLALSHDEVVHGKKTIIDKLWGTYAEKCAQLRTLYFYMYMHPGKKLNFMGNEMGHFREWDEKRELDWDLLKYPFHDAFQKYFAHLCRVYSTEPALYDGEYNPDCFEWVACESRNEGVYAWLRKGRGENLLCIMNTQDHAHKKFPLYLRFPCSAEEVLNTESPEWGGALKGRRKTKLHTTDGGVFGRDYTLTVDLPAMGSCLLRLAPEAPNPDAARISANKALNAKRRAARSTKAAANSNK